MAKKEIRIRCWVEIDGERLFGPGPAELLEKIEEEGSISQAAKQMGMSYKKAWDIVNRLNKHARKELVRSSKGGAAGGKAEITAEGKELIDGYKELTLKLKEALDKNKRLIRQI